MKIRMMRAGSTGDATGDPSAGWCVRPGRITPAVCALGLAALAPWAGAQPCEPAWSARFESQGLNGPVFSFARAGRGPAAPWLVGGYFTRAGGIAAAGIAEWDGKSWSSLGDRGVVGVRAIARVVERTPS